MWKTLKQILGTGKPVNSVDKTWVLREGKSMQSDEVHAAWVSGNLRRMMGVLNMKTNAIDRHFLLMNIVRETYKKRKNAEMANTCAQIAELHISEFPQIVGPLKKDLNGVLPRVPTFQHYATLLTEQGNFDRAIEVCQTALDFGLADGTKSGFAGRITRIRKKQGK